MVDVDTSSYASPGINKLLAAASNDPNAALTTASNALGVANQGIQIQRQQTALSSDQIAFGRQKLAAQNEVLFSIGADPTPENANQQIAEAVKAGKIDADTGNAMFAQVITTGGDPAKIKQLAFQHGAANASYDQQLQNMGMGAPTLVNTGGQLQPMTAQSGLKPSMNPAGGGAVPLTTAPEFNSAPRTWKTSDGVEHQGTQKQYQDAVGAGASSGGSGSAFADAAAGRTPPAAIAPPGGVPPAAQPSAAPPLVGQPAPKTMPPLSPPASPQNAGLAGPVPGLAQAQTVDADASAKQFAGITAAATNLPNMKATVSNMEAVLPQITTGPQAAAWNKVKSGVNFGTQLVTGKDAFDPHAIAAQDEFHNNSVKLAQQQFQALGGTGTDGQLASASGDVPNDSLSNMSNAQLLAMNKGLIDAQQARASAAQAWKEQHGPASYGGFVEDWNKSFSPRAFQYSYLSPADRGTMLHSMSPQEKGQLKTAYDTAVQRGWIAPQGAK